MFSAKTSPISTPSMVSVAVISALKVSLVTTMKTLSSTVARVRHRQSGANRLTGGGFERGLDVTFAGDHAGADLGAARLVP
ncbi:MAG: hypothetical protein ACRBK7_05505 [Acidimicrobiales bacterium]